RIGFLRIDRLMTHKQHHTYGDYLTWPDHPRQELIDGVAYVREPPAPSPCHQEMVGELFGQLWVALKGRPCRVYVAPFDVRLPKSDEANELIDTVVQPDVFIVCDRQKLDERGMRGGPDWVAEVLSPGTARYDQKIKVPVYERSGVPELWLIHPTNRTLTIYRLEDGRYGPPTTLELSGQTDLTAVPGVRIDWDRLLSQLLP
ncbi:MAG TPA: Uma2 family endonuclease, partial [Steroidobacteraceae bacterium]|nr:Uma2 family endonuclease [Steroidobacteraceae bacterium]